MDDGRNNTPEQEAIRIAAVKKWEASSEIDRALKWAQSIKETFINLNEYWNGDRNDQAMFDACNHTVEATKIMLDDFSGFEKVMRNLTKKAKDKL